jgi:hypothetical protein
MSMEVDNPTTIVTCGYSERCGRNHLIRYHMPPMIGELLYIFALCLVTIDLPELTQFVATTPITRPLPFR